MSDILIRHADNNDLDDLLALFRDLADGRSTAAPADNTTSAPVLAEILADPRRHLMVATVDDRLVGTAEVLIVANLTHQGRPWAVVENVVVSESMRRQGVGHELMQRLIDMAREADCYKLQLTSGKHRTGAHEFYRSLGLQAVAEGLKTYFEETAHD